MVEAKRAQKTARVSKAQVLAYLVRHPDFLVTHAGALGQLALPAKGGNILSLHAAKAEKAVARADKHAVKNQQLMAIAASNAAVAESVFGVVLAVVGCTTLGELRSYFQRGLLADLAVDGARLYLVSEMPSVNSLIEEEVLAVCPAPVTLRTLTTADERQMYGPKGKMMASDCLLRLHAADGALCGLLALGSREATRYHAGQSVELATFLGQLIGVRLGQLK